MALVIDQVLLEVIKVGIEGSIKRYSPDEIATLIQKSDYRQFIEEAMQLRSRRSSKFGFADLARSAGFASRSFPRDVVLGKKRISLQSVHKFSVGLGLTGDLAEYFRVLVEIEHSDCRVKGHSTSQLTQTLSNLRGRILAKNYIKLDEVDPTIAFQSHVFPMIYAALGEPEKGATIAEIRGRTQLDRDVILNALKVLLTAQIIQKVDDRYIAKVNHLSLPNLTEGEIFQKFFIHALERASLKARTNFKSDKHLFFASSFSVQDRHLPRLKDELRSVMLRYVDISEVASGDRVVSLVCGLI